MGAERDQAVAWLRKWKNKHELVTCEFAANKIANLPPIPEPDRMQELRVLVDKQACELAAKDREIEELKQVISS